MLHFSQGADIFYEDTNQLLADLQEASDKLDHSIHGKGGKLEDRKN